jgi:hypothetical protein
MIREWIKRRYTEADYRYLEARGGRWWDDKYIARRYRIRSFWARLGGKA